MASKLVIVESPSKAKTIKKYLGTDYEVMASQGHIIDLPITKFGIDVDNNFELEFTTLKGKAKIINDIKKEAKGKEKIYLATDPDREGEAIAWHLKNVLKIKEDEKCRVEFHEITEKAIKKAIISPSYVNNDLVEAQKTRRVLDRIVGYKISPLLWKKIKKGLSAGRVQSAIMKMIMDREREIRAFIPSEYWNLTAILNKENDSKNIVAKFYGDLNSKIELKSEEQTMKIVNDLEEAKYIIKEITKSERKYNSPAPFTTSSMVQEAARKLGFTSKRTMMIAQKLYEEGNITYMRTDSVRVSDDAIAMAKEYIINEYSVKYYQNKVFKTGKNAQDAHEAIRPTRLNNIYDLLNTLSPDEAKLMRLIFNRFLASQMSPAVYDTTKAVIHANNYVFVANGRILKFDGYKKLYIEGKDETSEKDDDSILPELSNNEELKLNELKPEQKFTEAPYRFTEATLVKTLEEKGIGRPSTYAPTISTVQDRMYVEKNGNQLVPTELGEVVNTVMENNFKDIVDEKFTANMENILDKIAEGKETYLKTVKEFYYPFIENLEKVENTIEKVKLKEEETDVVCELCGRNMVIRQGRYGKFLACPGFPECKNVKSIVNKIEEQCPKCGGDILIKKSKKGRKFYVCEHSPSTCDYISWNKPGEEEKVKNSYSKENSFNDTTEKATKTRTNTKVKAKTKNKLKTKIKSKEKAETQMKSKSKIKTKRAKNNTNKS